jgi:hypothetical protein
MGQNIQTRPVQNPNESRGKEMAKNNHFEDDKTDPVSPEEADRKGKVNVVKGIMNDPEVQGIIKESLLRETIKNAILMSCLLVGLLKLYDVGKTLINFNWVGDLIISLILIAIGLSYTVPSLLKKKK